MEKNPDPMILFKNPTLYVEDLSTSTLFLPFLGYQYLWATSQTGNITGRILVEADGIWSAIRAQKNTGSSSQNK